MKKDKIQELIEGSGNNFHSTVVKFFREKKWDVVISPYYNDNLSDKAREIDIIAEKSFDYRTSLGGSILVRLIIECKYIHNETIFWLG